MTQGHGPRSGLMGQLGFLKARQLPLQGPGLTVLGLAGGAGTAPALGPSLPAPSSPPGFWEEAAPEAPAREQWERKVPEAGKQAGGPEPLDTGLRHPRLLEQPGGLAALSVPSKAGAQGPLETRVPRVSVGGRPGLRSRRSGRGATGWGGGRAGAWSRAVIACQRGRAALHPPAWLRCTAWTPLGTRSRTAPGDRLGSRRRPQLSQGLYPVPRKPVRSRRLGPDANPAPEGSEGSSRKAGGSAPPDLASWRHGHLSGRP